MKRLAFVAGMLLCLTTPIKAKEPPQIIETTPIIPNPVILLQDEVTVTANWEDRGEDNTIQISADDADRLLRIAYCEAGNQGIQGQLMVMQTIWNRVQSEQFPNTIQEVIEQSSQFSSVSNGSYYKAVPTGETHLALAEFEKNLNHDSNLIGFETNSNGATLLKYFDFYTVYGDHTFYKNKKENP